MDNPKKPQSTEKGQARRSKGKEVPSDVQLSPVETANVLRFLNQAGSAEELAEQIEFPNERDVGIHVAQHLLARRASLGGAFRSLEDVIATVQVGPERLGEIIAAAGRADRPGPDVELERRQFRSLVLQNPNYFGNLEKSQFQPVKLIASNTQYEEMTCVGLNPAADRLEAVIHVKQPAGYGGALCDSGSFEYVRFYVDLFNNGTWHDVGLSKVRVHDIPGPKPLCYAVMLDFSSIRKFCLFSTSVRVRAILSWNVPPPANTPGFTPVYGNVRNVRVQPQPILFIPFQDLITQLELAKIDIPDPIGPIIKGIDPTVKLPTTPPEVLTLAQKKELYAQTDVPIHRFGFSEAQQVLQAPAATAEVFAGGGQLPLANLGLNQSEIADLLGKLQVITDGDTSFEELRCVGLYPEKDLLEAVLTVKKSSGYSGGLCTKGSTEYVAFWINFNDGAGFTYMGTATVQVHDIGNIPDEGLQYAVFLKTDLAKRLVPCEIGPRLVSLRAILSWETPPPPNNPNYVPTWGNREQCLVQLRPGDVTGHIPIIETIGSMGVDDIQQGLPSNPLTGLASGPSSGTAVFTTNQSPFGGSLVITGSIGDPPDAFFGSSPPFKYRVEVRRAGALDPWQPLLNTVPVQVTRRTFGIPDEQTPGDFLFEINLTPSDDGDGLGGGWYTYLEDYKGFRTQSLVIDKLAVWHTNAAMEGVWELRISAKDPATSPPTFFAGVQTIQVRIDNTAPSGPPAPGKPLTITGATFNGNPVSAVDCGKFPVGTIITGTYEIHDPGTSSPNQHFDSLSLSVIPAGPAPGATVNPPDRSFPTVSTNGEAGTWTLNTQGMDPCGYVVRLTARDRANVSGTGNRHSFTFDLGFCLEKATDHH